MKFRLFMVIFGNVSSFYIIISDTRRSKPLKNEQLLPDSNMIQYGISTMVWGISTMVWGICDSMEIIA